MIRVLAFSLLLSSTAVAEESPYRWRAVAELGFIGVARNVVQFGSDGTPFNLRSEGGQDILFPFTRFSGELELAQRHSIIFLYQPLTLQTQELLARDVRIDGQVFPANTPLAIKYGFDFYRLSYLFDFKRSRATDLAIGLSLQLRDADITFASLNGDLFRRNGGVGPVPALKFRGQHTFASGLFVATEIDAVYVSGRIISGSTNDFQGALLDAAVRVGLPLSSFSRAFASVRLLGGGAKGTDEDDSGPGDGFTENWLWTVSVSLGATLE